MCECNDHVIPETQWVVCNVTVKSVTLNCTRAIVFCIGICQTNERHFVSGMDTPQWKLCQKIWLLPLSKVSTLEGKNLLVSSKSFTLKEDPFFRRGSLYKRQSGFTKCFGSFAKKVYPKSKIIIIIRRNKIINKQKKNNK